MSRALIDTNGVAVQDTNPNVQAGGAKMLPEVSSERLLMACAMYFRDEINTIRTLGLLAQTSRSLDDVINGIKAKL